MASARRQRARMEQEAPGETYLFLELGIAAGMVPVRVRREDGGDGDVVLLGGREELRRRRRAADGRRVCVWGGKVGGVIPESGRLADFHTDRRGALRCGSRLSRD